VKACENIVKAPQPYLASGTSTRFIDRDLILWDSHANLIIDFIPQALSIADES